MFHYVTNQEFLSAMKKDCSDLINQLVQRINNEGYMEVRAELVGSGKRGLITQNAQDPIDLDYNLILLSFKRPYPNDNLAATRTNWSERQIKQYVQERFNFILQKNDWGDCSDSTSVLTTPYQWFKKWPTLKYQIDLAIVKKDFTSWQRLRHEKTGIVDKDSWYWNQSPDLTEVEEKASRLDHDGLWHHVQDRYLKKKNEYLTRNDHDHPSFIVYIETINEIFNRFYRSNGWSTSEGTQYVRK